MTGLIAVAVSGIAFQPMINGATRVIERHCHSPVPGVGLNDLCRKFWLAVMIRGSFDGPVRDGEGCRD